MHNNIHRAGARAYQYMRETFSKLNHAEEQMQEMEMLEMIAQRNCPHHLPRIATVKLQIEVLKYASLS